MYFRNYGIQKTWLDICLKSPVSVEPLTGNMEKRPKRCCNLDSTVTIFSHHFVGNRVGKSLF